MDILPAIDLRDGQVVRLTQGDYGRETIYSSSPADIARKFAAAGCRWIHMVDLDAAKSGQLTNLPAIAAVTAGVDLHVEVGGGIRDDASARRVLDAGVNRVIIGSAALEKWEWFEKLAHRPDMAGRVALGLDARNGKLAVHGWTREMDVTAVDIARRVKGWPLSAIIYTDISRDGMLTGPNFAATAELIAATDVGVIASGGVGGLEDIAECRRIGCAGAIIGRAYYEGKIDLAQALAIAG